MDIILKPKQVGYIDGIIGKGVLDNPYEAGTVEFNLWIDGLVDGIIAARDAALPDGFLDKGDL